MKSLRRIKKQTLKPWQLLLLVGGIILLGAALWYFFIHKQSPPKQTVDTINAINYNPPTSEETQATQEKKDEIIRQEENPQPPDATLNVTMSRSFQEAGTIHLRTVVTGTTTGECVATFDKSGHAAFTKTFAVSFEATNAFCKDASIPITDFPAAGIWDISLVVKKDNKQSTPITSTVEVKK